MKPNKSKKIKARDWVAVSAFFRNSGPMKNKKTDNTRKQKHKAIVYEESE